MNDGQGLIQRLDFPRLLADFGNIMNKTQLNSHFRYLVSELHVPKQHLLTKKEGVNVSDSA